MSIDQIDIKTAANPRQIGGTLRLQNQTGATAATGQHNRIAPDFSRYILTAAGADNIAPLRHFMDTIHRFQ